MPISADQFENLDGDGDGPTPGTNAHKILSFLDAHAEQAFTQSEFAEATAVTRGSVGPTLVRLREAGRVDHRGTYWRISDHDRSTSRATAHSSEVAASYEDEAWQAHAVDPREQRE